MENKDEVDEYIKSMGMFPHGSTMGTTISFINKKSKIGVEIDQKKCVATGFSVVDGDRDYNNLPDEMAVFVAACNKMIAGDAPEHDSEPEAEYVEADYEIVDDAAEQTKETEQSERKHMKETAIEPVHQDQNAALASVEALPITLKTVKAHICKNATDQELALFIETCRSHNLNPFIDEIYLVKYGQAAASTVIGKGVFLDRAFNNPEFDGFKAGIIVLDESGELQRREGAFRLDAEILVGGWCNVYMKNKKYPYVGEIRLADYVKTKIDQSTKKPVPTKFWKTIPETMIRKVALSQTLKEAMPGEFNQLWDADALVIDAEVVEK